MNQDDIIALVILAGFLIAAAVVGYKQHKRNSREHFEQRTN